MRRPDNEPSGIGELKAVADQVLETGARYLERGRDWLDTRATRSDEMRREREWNEGREAMHHGAGGRRRDAYDAHGLDDPWMDMARDGRGGPYAPDEYSFRETGAHGHGYGYEEGDRHAREYDRYVDRVARSSAGGRDELYATGASHQDAARRQGSDRGDGPGARRWSGDDRAARFGYGFGSATYGTGFEEPRAYGDSRERPTEYRSQRGHGPRGYVRSDGRILEDVCERLSEDPLVDARGIDVRCDKGQIVLDGEVPNRGMKHRAEDIADAVMGANEVDNRLRVNRGGTAQAQQSQAQAGKSSAQSQSASQRTGGGTGKQAESAQPQQPH